VGDKIESKTNANLVTALESSRSDTRACDGDVAHPEAAKRPNAKQSTGKAAVR